MALSAIGSGAPFSSCAQLGGRLPPAAARAGGSLLGPPPGGSAPRPFPRPGGLRRGPAAGPAPPGPLAALRGACAGQPGGLQGKRGSGARGLGSLGRGWRRLGEFPSKKTRRVPLEKKKKKKTGRRGGRQACAAFPSLCAKREESKAGWRVRSQRGAGIRRALSRKAPAQTWPHTSQGCLKAEG